MTSTYEKEAERARIMLESLNACKEHSWGLLESHQYKNLSGYGSYHRRDQFYCSKCLEIKIVSRDLYVKSGDDIKHYRPDWFTYVL